MTEVPPGQRIDGRSDPHWPLAGPLLRYGLPAAVGTALRLHHLGDQILGGDEFHAVRAAFRPLGRILTTFQLNDNSIPLTTLYHLLSQLGLPLSEALLRAPIIASGVLLLLLVPPLLARSCGRDAATLLAWLLAFSPELVLYSRIVRPYMPALLCALGAVIAFERWLDDRRTVRCVGYLALGILAVWLHPVAAPFVLAPLAFGAALHVYGDAGSRRQAPSWTALLLLGAGFVAGFAAMLLPGLDSFLEALPSRRQEATLGLAELIDVARLQTGSVHLPLVLLFFAAAARGLWVLAGRGRFAAYSAWLVGSHLVTLIVTTPYQVHVPMVFQRYALFVLPLLLCWVAVGTLAPWSDGRGARRIQLSFGFAFIVALIAGGPLVQPGFRTSSFSHHNEFAAFHRAPGRIPEADVPAFYRELSASPSGQEVLEFPWFPWWDLARSFPAYQAIHGQPVRVVPQSRDLPDPRLRLRNLVPPNPSALLNSGARWLVIHLDIGREEDAVVGDAGLLDRETTRSYRRRLWPQLRESGHALAARLELLWGPPDRADEILRVWDLARIRRQESQVGSRTEPVDLLGRVTVRASRRP